MTSQTNLFGPALRNADPDLSKGRHNTRSKAAHDRVLPFKSSTRQRCLEYIDSQGSYGATLQELCIHLDKLPHQLSGRLTELRADGKIFVSTKVRGNYGVYVTAAYPEASR